MIFEKSIRTPNGREIAEYENFLVNDRLIFNTNNLVLLSTPKSNTPKSNSRKFVSGVKNRTTGADGLHAAEDAQRNKRGIKQKRYLQQHKIKAKLTRSPA